MALKWVKNNLKKRALIFCILAPESNDLLVDAWYENNITNTNSSLF